MKKTFATPKVGGYDLGLNMIFFGQKQRYRIMLFITAVASMMVYLIGTIGETETELSKPILRAIGEFSGDSFSAMNLIYKQHTFSWQDFTQANNNWQFETYQCF